MTWRLAERVGSLSPANQVDHLPEFHPGNPNGVPLVRLNRERTSNEIDPRAVGPGMCSAIELRETARNRSIRRHHEIEYMQNSPGGESRGQRAEKTLRFAIVEMMHEAVEEYKVELAQIADTFIDVADQESPGKASSMLDIASVEVQSHIVALREVNCVRARTASDIQDSRSRGRESVPSNGFKFLSDERSLPKNVDPRGIEDVSYHDRMTPNFIYVAMDRRLVIAPPPPASAPASVPRSRRGGGRRIRNAVPWRLGASRLRGT